MAKDAQLAELQAKTTALEAAAGPLDPVGLVSSALHVTPSAAMESVLAYFSVTTIVPCLLQPRRPVTTLLPPSWLRCRLRWLQWLVRYGLPLTCSGQDARVEL